MAGDTNSLIPASQNLVKTGFLKTMVLSRQSLKNGSKIDIQVNQTPALTGSNSDKFLVFPVYAWIKTGV
jgi:hypothetical protein